MTFRSWIRGLLACLENPPARHCGETPRRKRPSFRPRLETLEDRVTPTIIFNPQLGAEVAGDAGGYKLIGIPVHLIYWGAYWNATNSAPVTNALVNVIAGPYTRSLNQYGTNGSVASVSSLISNYPSPRDGFLPGDFTGVISNAIDNQGLPETDANNFDHSLYVVITPPGITAGAWKNSGFNGHQGMGGFLDSDTTTAAWISTPAGGTPTLTPQMLDGVTATFSREFADSLTDPEQGDGAGVRLPFTNPQQAGQIAEFEPATPNQPHYAYRLNGNLVQPYWSQQDKAFVVPDGNRQRFTLDPIWTGSGTTFTGTYHLSVRGDQLGGANADTVVVSTTASGGVQITLNGEVAQFEPGVIADLTINTGGGADTVLVRASASSLRTTVTSGTFSYRYAESDGSVLYSSVPPVLKGTDLVQTAIDPITGIAFRTVLASNIQSFLVANGGTTLYALGSDGTLYHQFAGIPFSVLTTSVANMITPYGGSTLYVLNRSNMLFEAPVGAGDSGSAYYSAPARVSVQDMPDGTVYFLTREGYLYNATRGVLISGGVSSFSTVPDGTVYLLTTGGDLYNANRGILLSGGIQSFSTIPDGTVYALHTNGNLDNASRGVQLTGGVQSFSTVPDGTVYYLTTGGNLYNANRGILLTGGVQSFSTVPDGTVYYLTTGGNLYNALRGILISGGVSSFSTVPDGTVYLLTTGGNLYNANRGILLSGGVKSFATVPDGNIYFLTTGGNLYNALRGVLISGSVTSFSVGADGGVSFLQNGTQYYADEQQGAITPATGSYAPAISGVLTQTYPQVEQTTVSVRSNNNPSVSGQTVTFTATITNTTGGATPAGSVEFFDGSTDLGSGTSLSGSGNVVTSTFTTSALAAGSHSILAKFKAAETFFASGSGTITQTVQPVAYVVAELSGAGVWRYSTQTGWTQLTASNAMMVAGDDRGDVVAEFQGAGVWRYEDATGWWQLTAANASQVSMAGSGTVAAEFQGAGVWRYRDTTGWQQLTSTDATSLSVDAAGDVAAQLADAGVWRYQDAAGWAQLTAANASQVSIAGNGIVAVEIQGAGVWRYRDAEGWQQLTSTDASSLSVDAAGDVAAQLADAGVWRYEDATGWEQLTAANASQVVIDALGAVSVELPGSGVWRYGAAGWKRLTPVDASSIGA